MALDALAERLQALLSHGALPSTALGARGRVLLRPLFDGGVLEERRAGGGRRIVVRDREALERFARTLYPSGLDGPGQSPEDALSPRCAAVAGLRDAKRARGGSAEPVLLRAFGAAELRRNGQASALSLPVADWTARAGVAAIRLDDELSWGFAGAVAIVENLEVFLQVERLGLACDLAVYAGGRVSRRLLAWLASAAMAGSRYVHCGDYDPVGLDEYLRLLAACPGRVSLHLPDGLEEWLAAYGKADLLRVSASVLARVRKHSDPTARTLVGWMDRYGVGLEQELLLAPRRGGANSDE
jgi:hypothetical protein